MNLLHTPPTYRTGIFFIFILMFYGYGCAFKPVIRSKGLTYLKNGEIRGVEEQKLNVFAPVKGRKLKDVMVFIHGGNWNSGNKRLYSYLGNRFARKGIVTVVIDYPLSPKAGYKEMAESVAHSVKWVRDHIEEYGGNPRKIFVSGHSAGGHLASLVSVNNRYFDSIGISNPIKGTILIDAAGLDMYTYLKQEGLGTGDGYMETFGMDPAQWKEASPIYFLHPEMPSMLIYVGGRTYPSILEGNDRFMNALKVFVPGAGYHLLKGKKHVPMILQFFNTWNSRYKEIIDFMQIK